MKEADKCEIIHRVVIIMHYLLYIIEYINEWDDTLGRLVKMKLRHFILNIAIISLAFVIFIIWYNHYFLSSVDASSPNTKYYKVYLITTDKGFQYWGILNQGAKDMADLIGVQYIWDAPEVRSTREQIEIINRAVQDGADALLIAADDPKRISGAVEDAKARNVQIVYVDSPAYEEAITTLTTDNYAAGVTAARTMIEILENIGINGGAIGIINLAEKENTKLREDGFRKVIEEDGRFSIPATIYTESDRPEFTQPAAERMILENPDLVGLFGASEGTSIGVGRAIKASDNKYVGVGFDNTQIMQQLLKDGNLKAIIAQNPYTMGYLGMAEAIAAIMGKQTGPDYINTGVSVLTQD